MDNIKYDIVFFGDRCPKSNVKFATFDTWDMICLSFCLWFVSGVQGLDKN
jgi:hypothetical protein